MNGREYVPERRGSSEVTQAPLGRRLCDIGVWPTASRHLRELTGGNQCVPTGSGWLGLGAVSPPSVPNLFRLSFVSRIIPRFLHSSWIPMFSYDACNTLIRCHTIVNGLHCRIGRR